MWITSPKRRFFSPKEKSVKFARDFNISLATFFDEQAKAGYSLAAQVDRIKSFIKSHGWAACDIHSDDGYSTKDRKRPALKRLIDDASEKRFNAVLVYKIERLSRRLKDLIEIVEELAHYDIGFKSITELIDTTTPEGRLMFHRFGSFAQYERELIGQRTKMGMIKRLKSGKWNGAPARYGYYLNSPNLRIKENKAKIVRLIYDLADSENMSAINIARYFNEKKIKGMRGKWRQNAVHRILTNPVYIGCLVCGGLPRQPKRQKGKFGTGKFAFLIENNLKTRIRKYFILVVFIS
ncbi:MAG: recombinase family protein [Candidatus Omnitrophica bacterium]|nr:recombinase family protein [Candidatus Omnitrophota bacterium]